MKKQPAMSLPEDLLIEILARVPYRSLCRFKCVSQSWLALCSDPDLRKRSPQALSGFFCFAHDDKHHELRFLNLSGKGRPLVDPGLPFLRGLWDGGVRVLDCCSSLLLCLCRKSSSVDAAGADYVVCNPATEKWTVLPATKELHPKNIIRLGFDPAVPSRFAVFVLVQDLDDGEITSVEIFSSETARWSCKQSQWGHETSVDDDDDSFSAFFNGTLHLTTRDSSVITVDTEGKTWHKIRMPLTLEDTADYGFITEFQGQGRLYAMHMDYSNDEHQLSVWVLENYASGQWTVKHTANMGEIVGEDEVCAFVAVYSERNLIIHVSGLDDTLVSYNMDNRKTHVIFSFEGYFLLRCYPYIPCYTEWLLKAAP